MVRFHALQLYAVLYGALHITAYTTRDAAHVPATSYLIDFIISYKTVRFSTR
jgi:hypothetical protein